MAFISETLQMRRLTESGVNIKTTYIVDGTLRYSIPVKTAALPAK